MEPPPRSHIPSVPPSVDVNSTTIEYFHSEEVARQLSLHFFQLFEAIKPSEFLVLSLKWVPGDINKQPLTANELQTKVLEYQQRFHSEIHSVIYYFYISFTNSSLFSHILVLSLIRHPTGQNFNRLLILCELSSILI